MSVERTRGAVLAFVLVALGAVSAPARLSACLMTTAAMVLSALSV